VVAVSAVLYLKYRLDNTPDNKDLEAAISATLKKMHEPQRGGDTGIGWMQPTFPSRVFGNKTMVWHKRTGWRGAGVAGEGS
jgi:hypothetical protein